MFFLKYVGYRPTWMKTKMMKCAGYVVHKLGYTVTYYQSNIMEITVTKIYIYIEKSTALQLPLPCYYIIYIV